MNQDAFSEREQPVDVLRGNESIFRDADPANVAESLPEENRDHLLTQARSELMRQELNSLNNCISELQQQAYAEDWNYRTLNSDAMSLDENKFVFYKNFYEGKSTSRYSDPKYEM